MPFFRALFALLLLLSVQGVARASCSQPLATTQSLLDNLQTGGSWNPTAAAACFPEGATQSESAVHLKQILDARGLFIDFQSLSTDPDFKNALGEHKVVLHKRAPKIYLTKIDERWVFSPETVEAVPTLYSQSFSGLALSVSRALPSAFHKPLAMGIQGWQLVLFGLLGLVAVMTGRIAHFILQNQVVRIAKRLRMDLSQDFVDRMRRPLTLAASGGVFMVGIPDLQFGVRTSATLYLFAQALLSVSIMLIFLRLADMVTDLWSIKAEETDTKLDDQLIPLANRAVKVVIWALGLLSILDNLGVDVTSLLAGVTISGLAIALAAKDTVENLFGSIMIFVDRPFQIDDYIEVGGVGGTVEEVGFRSTRLRTLIGSVVTIPNGAIATAQVNNMGLRTARRMRFNLGFTYGATREQINDFCTRASVLIEGDERLLDGHEVAMVNFGDSAIEIMIHAFATDLGWSNDLKINHDIRMNLWALADEIGLSFAFPSQSLYVESLPDSGS
jgi:MscS family membrane protein